VKGHDANAQRLRDLALGSSLRRESVRLLKLGCDFSRGMSFLFRHYFFFAITIAPEFACETRAGGLPNSRRLSSPDAIRYGIGMTGMKGADQPKYFILGQNAYSVPIVASRSYFGVLQRGRVLLREGYKHLHSYYEYCASLQRSSRPTLFCVMFFMKSALAPRHILVEAGRRGAINDGYEPLTSND